ncbi:MAG: class I SAM-dependent methyltransferase [Kiloniellales bacterium]
MKIDFGRTAEDYGRHRAGFPDALFDRLGAFGLNGPGLRVVDLGTGTGSLARGFARRGAEVVGLDPSRDLMAEARRLDGEAGVRIAYVVGRAERTGLAGGAFDLVAAGQCWHWFDRPVAAEEARRLLKPGGHLLICHFDWVPLPGNVVQATESLILEHNPGWASGGMTGIHAAWLADAAVAGFRDLETFSFDQAVRYSHEAWRGRVRASAGVGASLPADAEARFDRALASILAERFPTDPLEVPHRVFALVARAP